MTAEWRVFDVPVPDAEYECDPVGKIEVADRFGVREHTVNQWMVRNRMPEPDWPSINGYRAWNWATLLWWAGETGRLNTDDLVAQYRKMFGVTEPDLSDARKLGPRHRKDAKAGLPKLPT